MKEDNFGNRMKFYEQQEAGRKVFPLIPCMARLDGKGFSKFTKNLQRPYDIGMSRAMILTTMFLVEETNACVGFTQSDEISLVYYSDRIDSEIFFDGKIQKMTSTLAAMATAKFNSLLDEHIPNKVGLLPTFDCRVWNVPNQTEAANTILWRELDASKNSISMTAQHYYSHNELMGKNSSEKLQMLEAKGIIWGDYPGFFKRGTFIQRRKVMMELDETERLKIPEKHRPPAGKQVERTKVCTLDMPPFNKVVNRVGVIFNGESPMDEADRIQMMIREDEIKYGGYGV